MRFGTVLFAAALISCGGSGESENRRQNAAARPRAYVPPADGRLAETQVARYVAFLQNRARISAVDADSESDARGDRSSVAARALGINPDEARWIGQKVLEARIRIEEKQAEKRNLETYRTTLASLKKALGASSDPATRTTVSRQIAELERESGEIERSLRRPTEKVLASNEALVLRFRIELESARGALPASR